MQQPTRAIPTEQLLRILHFVTSVLFFLTSFYISRLFPTLKEIESCFYPSFREETAFLFFQWTHGIAQPLAQINITL